MTPPAPAASAATPTTTGSVIVDRQRLLNIAKAGAIIPKTLTEAREILRAIAAGATEIAATGTPTVSAACASLAKIKQQAAADVGKMTDKQLLEHYVELQGAERRAFFAIHGAAIWRAHEKSARGRFARD